MSTFWIVVMILFWAIAGGLFVWTRATKKEKTRKKRVRALKDFGKNFPIFCGIWLLIGAVLIGLLLGAGHLLDNPQVHHTMHHDADGVVKQIADWFIRLVGI